MGGPTRWPGFGLGVVLMDYGDVEIKTRTGTYEERAGLATPNYP